MKQTSYNSRDIEMPGNGDLGGLLALLDKPVVPLLFDDGLLRLAVSVAALQRVRDKAA